MTLIQLHPPRPAITWEILPDDFILPDDPVENNLQPLLAAALRESLELAGLILLADVIATNFGLCAKIDDKTVVKAPNWLWIRDVPAIPEGKIRRSYTPHAEGPVPLIVMEFISETEGQEYSFNPHYPYGKWYFYEQILQVPIYVIFHPYTGELDVYRLQENSYRKQITDEHGRYWLPEFGLFLGVWQGSRGLMTANWLRWWDSSGSLMLWGKELIEQVQQQADQEYQRAEQLTSDLEQERSTRQLLEGKLRELGIDPVGVAFPPGNQLS